MKGRKYHKRARSKEENIRLIEEAAIKRTHGLSKLRPRTITREIVNTAVENFLSKGGKIKREEKNTQSK